ncbi:MAG: hypothetical protein HQK83_17450 [Fibrobacteria bacterium]|nr:hypothetical protein [Fibrobacteria bacterium]
MLRNTRKMKIVTFLPVFLLFQLLNASLPPKGTVSLHIKILHAVTSKSGPSDSSFTFEELISYGLNGVVISNYSFSSGKLEYTQSEWVKECHDYGLWVGCNILGEKIHTGLIEDAKSCASIGADYIQILQPYTMDSVTCVPFNGSFNKPEFDEIVNAVKEASPSKDCPVIMRDASCNQMFADWNTVDGLIQMSYSDAYHINYAPQILDYKQNYPAKFAGVCVWLLGGDIANWESGAYDYLTGPPLPDDRFESWFSYAYTNTNNVFLDFFNKKSKGESGSYGTNWDVKKTTITGLLDTDTPLPEWRNFSPGTDITSSSPDCRVQVRTVFDGGLDPGFVECYYAVDSVKNNNTKWIKHDRVTATGSKGTQDWVTITAEQVPFNQVSGTLNKVMFRIRDNYPYQYYRNPRIWKREFKVNIVSLDWFNLGDGGSVNHLPATLAINIQHANGLDVSSAFCEYSTDGGGTWERHPVVCSGEKGTTDKETVTAVSLPLKDGNTKNNIIRFSIKTSTGDTLKSAEYPVLVKIPPVISHLETQRNENELDFTLRVHDDDGIQVGSGGAQMDDETIVLLPLDGSPEDVSGNGYNGRLYGDAAFIDHETWKSKGGMDKTLYLDGDNDFVDMGFGSLGRRPELTVSFWVKAENELSILSLGEHDAQGALQIWGMNNAVRVGGWDSERNYFQIETSSGSFSHNEWHQIVFTFDGTIAKVYVDGNLEGSGDWPTFRVTKFSPFRLGNPVNRWQFFKGYIDEVHLVNRVLYDYEIASGFSPAMYSFSTDGGVTWNKWLKAGYEGAKYGDKDATIDLTGVPMGIGKDSLNRIRIAVRDVNGNGAGREFVLLGSDAVPLEPIDRFQLDIRPFPNPFYGKTQICFSLTSSKDLSLDIFASNGRLVRRYNKRLFEVGSHSFVWDGRDDDENILSAGQYFVRVSVGGRVFIKNLVMLK